MTHGAVAEWKVTEGQTIAAGDVLADIETDKATMALESMEDGVVAKILVQNGAADVKVGTVLGVMAEDAADVRAFASYEAPPPPEEEDGGASDASPLNVSGMEPEPSNAPDLGRVWPSVRRLLAESGLDGSGIAPTGPKRTLTKGDVLAAMGLCAPPKGSNDFANDSSKASSVPSSVPSSGAEDTAASYPEEPSFDDLAVTPTRRVIASRLLESKTARPAPLRRSRRRFGLRRRRCGNA
jgi:pyruvate/2-oxoglutarate dehydrogenase complex dihydrolipoamide acyltransferase (E2) component